MQKTSRRVLAIVLALVMALSVFSISASAAVDNYNPDYESTTHSVFKHTEQTLAPGVTQYTNYAYTKADGKQMVYYVTTADVTRDDVMLQVSYKGMQHESYGMEKLTQTVAAANAKYSDPSNPEYISDYYSVVSATNGNGYNMKTGQPTGVWAMGGEVIQDYTGSTGFFAILKDGRPVMGKTVAEWNAYKADPGIEEAINAGYKVLVIDSLTPEWTFINEVHDAMKGNSFQNWGKVKPRHTKMMDYIMASPIHIICCARGKDTWVLEDQNGKQVPRKVGMGASQDKDITYQYTISFTLNDQDKHTYETDKDNTHLFEGIYGKQLTEKDGQALYQWANSSDIPATVKETKKYTEATVDDAEKIAVAQKSVIELMVSLGGTKNTEAMAILKSYAKTGNPKQIKTLAELEEVYKKLNAVKPVTEEYA